MDFSGASRKENEPKVVSIGPNKDVVDWFVEAGSFPRNVPKQELLRASFDKVVKRVFSEIVEFSLIKSRTELKEVVKIAGDCRGFGAALYSGFSTEVYPVILTVKMVVLSKAVCFKEFLSLKATCLFGEQQAKSVRH